MPVILPPDLYQKWLDYETPEEELKTMWRPFPAEGMTAPLVKPVMHEAGVEGPERHDVAAG